MKNVPSKLDELLDRMLTIQQDNDEIVATAAAEGRDWTDEEASRIDHNNAEYERLEADRERYEKVAAQAENLAVSLGRRTDPDDIPAQNGGGDAQNSGSGMYIPTRKNERISLARADGKWGWEGPSLQYGLGMFANAVKMASGPGGHVDPRLIANAPTSFGQEAVGGDGGFAVPPDFRQAIATLVFGEDRLIGRTDQLTTSSNNITVPIDEHEPWNSTGGIQAYWEGEGKQATQSRPLINSTTVRLNKLIAMVPMTDELIDDAPALGGYLNRKAPERIDFMVSNAIVNGSGAGQPLGIMQSPAKVEQAAEGGQTADTVVFENVIKMWSRLYAPYRQNAVWLIHPDVEPQLQLAHAGVTSSGGHIPVYLPPGGISATPYGTLMGRPVIPHQACATVGDTGDIILWAPDQYMSATKTGGGIRTDVSIHLFFDYDMTAFRFVLRVAGQPWLSSAISPRSGTLTQSSVVALAAR
jgi:HK97 family phage major capsid protein